MMTSDIFSHVFNGYKVLILVYRNSIACQTNHNVLYCVAWCFRKCCVTPDNPFSVYRVWKKRKLKNTCHENAYSRLNVTLLIISLVFISYVALASKLLTNFLVFNSNCHIPPATTHSQRFDSVFFVAERQAGKPWILIFVVIGLTQPGFEPEPTYFYSRQSAHSSL